MKYSVDDLVKLAKRENNNIRSYLYVNPLQGKHIPARPEDTLDMCRELAGIVNNEYPEDMLFVIGFAETATGIASGVSDYLNNVVYYQNTTREIQENAEYLYFTESHSHATDQMLRISGLADCINEVDRIIFIDDEVTTGNTICKLYKAIMNVSHVNDVKVSIVSVLNSMTQERREELTQMGFDCLFLSPLPFEYKKESIEGITYDPSRDTSEYKPLSVQYETMVFNAHVNPRMVSRFEDYRAENLRFTGSVMATLADKHYGDVLVLGTEEFMYSAIMLGNEIKKAKISGEVRTHATTRSPIIASGSENYPLFHRYRIRSLYDSERNTYIYNLKKYDKVIIVTDSTLESEGTTDLLCALESAGNDDIVVAQWKYDQ